MKEWKLQAFLYNTMSLENKVWSDWRDKNEKVLPIMSIEEGVIEMVKTYKWINRALCLRLFNISTGETIPVEAFE